MPAIYKRELFQLQRNFLEVFLADAIGRNDELAAGSYTRKLDNLNRQEQLLIELQQLEKNLFADQYPMIMPSMIEGEN